MGVLYQIRMYTYVMKRLNVTDHLTVDEEEVVLPDGLHVVFLPPYSPELQPAEHVWSLSDEALVNTHFGDLEALMEAQAERCRRLREQPEIIHAYTRFH